MSRDQLLGGVVSVAVHAGLLALLVFQLPPKLHSPGDGAKVQTIEVFLVPGDRPGESAAADAPADSAEPDAPTAIAGTAPSSTDMARSEPSVPGRDGGGAAAPSSGFYASSADYSDYRHRLLDHIRPHQFYPDDARPDRLGGVVQVGFAMQRDGTILEIWVESSSGYAVLDQAALDTVRRAQPLPLVPAVLPNTMDVMLPISFTPPRLITRG